METAYQSLVQLYWLLFVLWEVNLVLKRVSFDLKIGEKKFDFFVWAAFLSLVAWVTFVKYYVDYGVYHLDSITE